MSLAYPLPRETRETAVLDGDGSAGPYGPTGFRVFDLADVRVWRRDAGAAFFTDVTATSTVARTAGQPYDTVSVTLAAALGTDGDLVVQARRTAERSVSVLRAIGINGDQLDKELSKIATALSELRRDVDRGLSLDVGQTGRRAAPGGPDTVPRWDPAGNLVPGPSVAEVAAAGAHAAAALAARILAQQAAAEAVAAVPALIFGTMANLRAFAGTTTAISVSVIGYHSPLNARGGGDFHLDPTDTTTADDGGVTIVDAAGRRWKRRISGVVTDYMFGVQADDTADDTAALGLFAAHIRARRGGRYALDGGTRRVWPTAQPHATVLMDLTGASGRIDFLNGAKIHCVTPNSTTDATQRVGIIFDVTGTTGLTVERPWVEQDGAKVPPFTAGILLFAHSLISAGRMTGFRATGVRQTGGIGGMIVYPAASTSREDISRDIVLEGEFDRVYYPANFQGNGDDVRAVLRSRDCGRTYFPYNVCGHDVDVDSNNGAPFDDVEISCYTLPALRNRTSDIQVRYRLRRTGAETAAGNMVQLQIVQGDGTSRGGFIENVHVHYDVAVGAYPGAALQVAKADASGDPDDTARGHTLRNVTFSGRIDGIFATNPLQICSRENWTGELVYACGFDRFSADFNNAEAVDVTLDGRAVNASLGGFFFDRTVIAGAGMAFANTAGRLSIVSSWLDGKYADGIVSSGGIDWRVLHQRGGRVRLTALNVTVPSSGLTVTLPFAAAGGENPFVQVAPAEIHGFSVAPGSSSTFNVNHDKGDDLAFSLLVELTY